jgi:hypothetical protein
LASAVAYIFVEELGRRAAAKLLTRDEARRIAVNIAKLPEPTQPSLRCPLLVDPDISSGRRR